MKRKIEYKIIELVHFKKPLGIFTVRKIETHGRIVVSSKVYESTNYEKCLEYIELYC